MKLHFVNDEKIINRTIDEFDSVFPGANLWVVANRHEDFRIVEKRPNVIGRDEFLSKHTDGDFEEVYIHLLNPRKMNLVNRLKTDSRRKIYWIIWGLDLYNKLLVPRGFKLFTKENPMARKNPIGKWWKNIWRKKSTRKTIRFIREQVDYIVTDTTENDYDYLMSYYPELKEKPHKDFFYYPIDVILNDELRKSRVDGTDIMIGNSASATNNHHHVLETLNRLDIGDRRVVVPLSYSGKKKYVESVVSLGKKLFGERFVPLLTFMPLADYNKQQAATSVALFGNLRQEAIGNIIIALYLGAKVFLIKSNPVFAWAEGHGLKVFDLENITQQQLDTPLDDATMKRNREILDSLYTRERMHRLISRLPEKGDSEATE